MYRMHLHNGISHLAVAARPATPRMSEARDQMAAREEWQAAGMFRAAARNEGRCFDRSPDLISSNPAEQKEKKQNRKAPNPRPGVLKSSRNPKNKKNKRQNEPPRAI